MKRQAIGLAVAATLAARQRRGVRRGKRERRSIHACRIKKHGLVRIPETGEVVRTHRDRADLGHPGPAGPAAAGPGRARWAGKARRAIPAAGGAASLGALVGTPCTTFEGEHGTVSIDVTATDLILLQCDAVSGGARRRWRRWSGSRRS